MEKLNNLVWTALITPMDEDGSVHLEDFRKLLRIQERAGNGILLFGSTGEGLSLQEDEKKLMLQLVSDMNLQVPVMAGVGGFQLEKQKMWIEACCSAGVDALLLVAPLYAKPGVQGQITWFKELLNHADRPCMFYNIPSRTGVKIEPEVLKELSGHANSWAVKEASGSIADYSEFVKRAPSMTIYAGDDFMLPFVVRIGSQGVVSVASNVWPEQTRRYAEACFRKALLPEYHVWSNAVAQLFSAPNPIPVKALLKQKGVIESDHLRLPLSRADLSSLEKIVEADRQVCAWSPENR